MFDAGPFGFAAEGEADGVGDGCVGGVEPVGSGDEDAVFFGEALGGFGGEVLR